MSRLSKLTTPRALAEPEPVDTPCERVLDGSPAGYP